MKLTYNKWILVLFSIVLVSCDKENESITLKESVESTNSKMVKVEMENRIGNLLEEMFAKHEESEIEIILAQYRAMTPKEFLLYQKLQLEREERKLRNEGMVTAENGLEKQELTEDEILNEIQNLKEIRSNINSIALDKYGKYPHKLNYNQMEEVYKATNKVYMDMNQTQEVCHLISYPGTTRPTSVWGSFWRTYTRRVNDIFDVLCDYEYHFDGYHRYIKPGNAASSNATGGGWLIYNHASGNTHTLVGGWSVINNVGNGGNLSIFARP